MSTDLDLRELDELRRTLAAMEAHSPLAPDLEVVRLAPTRRRSRPVVGVVAAVVAAAVLVGVPALMIRDGDTDVTAPASPPTIIDWDIQISLTAADNPDPLLSAVAAIDGVAETQYVEDVAVLWSPPPVPLGGQDPIEMDTIVPGTTAVGEAAPDPVYAVMYLRLTPDADPDTVAAALEGPLAAVSSEEDPFVEVSPEIAADRLDAWFAFAADGALVVADDPVVVQPPPGPEPRFDTSGLGGLVELGHITATEDLLLLSFDPDPARPVVHVGSVSEVDARLVIYGTDDDIYRAGHKGAECEVVVIAGDRYQPGCRLETSADGFGLSGSGHSTGDGTGVGFVTVRVPVETAAVAITIDGGSAQWQRPIAGWALFAGNGWTYDITLDGAVVVTAYDSAGNMIGEWDGSPRWWVSPTYQD